jgi:hypothetical protein
MEVVRFGLQFRGLKSTKLIERVFKKYLLSTFNLLFVSIYALLQIDSTFI